MCIHHNDPIPFIYLRVAAILPCAATCCRPKIILQCKVLGLQLLRDETKKTGGLRQSQPEPLGTVMSFSRQCKITISRFFCWTHIPQNAILISRNSVIRLAGAHRTWRNIFYLTFPWGQRLRIFDKWAILDRRQTWIQLSYNSKKTNFIGEVK